MTPHEQRVAIAEACGWTYIMFTHDYDRKYSNPPEGTSIFDLFGCPKIEDISQKPQQLPDFPNDLNAMHEAWLTLPLELKFLFASILRDVVERDYDATNGKGAFAALSPSLQLAEISNATAPQRAETFVRTIGKWEESA